MFNLDVTHGLPETNIFRLETWIDIIDIYYIRGMVRNSVPWKTGNTLFTSKTMFGPAD